MRVEENELESSSQTKWKPMISLNFPFWTNNKLSQLKIVLIGENFDTTVTQTIF